MGKTKITFAFLAYKNDSELVTEAQRAAMKAVEGSKTLEASYVLLDDAWCPVTKEAREKFLSRPRSSVVSTGYRRGFMILGGENLAGQCEAFCEAAEATDADVLVKVDAETMIFKTDWLEEFAATPEARCAGAFDFGNANHTSVFGLCYALKREVLRPLLDDVRKFPAHHKAWEDHEVSSRVFRICGGDMASLLRWRSNTHGDDFWVIPLNDANDTLVNARAANFAWDYSATPEGERPAYRAKVAAMMRRLNDLKENKQGDNKDNEKDKEA